MLPDWTRHEVAGRAVEAFAPPGRPRHLLLYLHPVGGEMPSANAAYTAAFAQHEFAVVAPHGGPCWWADRISPDFDSHATPEQYLLGDLTAWAEAHFNMRLRAAAGVSMGGQAAVRLGFKHPGRFPVVGSVAGAFDVHEYYGRGTPLDAMYRTREACRQDTAILHIRPQPYPPHVWFACDPGDETWFRGNDRLAEKLAAHGLPFTADLTTRVGGHTWAYFDAMAGPMCAFLAVGLAAESRRLM